MYWFTIDWLICSPCSSPEDSQPFVLLGAHSTRKNIHSCEKTTSNNNTAIGNSGINGAPAKHMVRCQKI